MLAAPPAAPLFPHHQEGRCEDNHRQDCKPNDKKRSDAHTHFCSFATFARSRVTFQRYSKKLTLSNILLVCGAQMLHFVQHNKAFDAQGAGLPRIGNVFSLRVSKLLPFVCRGGCRSRRVKRNSI